MIGRPRPSPGGGPNPDANADADGSALANLMLAVGARPAWLVVGALIVVALATRALDVSVPAWLTYLPFAVSLVAFGLPHGAVDHLAAPRAAGRPVTVRWLALVGVVYLLLGGAYLAVWTVAPVPAAAFFVALTWFHWGQGDLYALDILAGGHLDRRGVRVGTLLVRGGLPMLVPLLSFPADYRTVVDAWVALFGRRLDVTWLFAVETRLALGVAFAALTVGTLLVGRRDVRGDAGARRGWRLDAGETLLLWLLFLVVPPILAVGVYFCVWHSLRHVVRLVGVDDRARRRLAADAGGPVAALARTGREAVPLTALSLVFLVGFGVAVGVTASVSTLAALYLVFISVLTLPHVAVVSWMDYAESRYAPATTPVEE